jgi:hypothetical protein
MDLRASIDRDGYAILPSAIDPAMLEPLRRGLQCLTDESAGSAPSDRLYGERNLLRRVPVVRELARELATGPLVAPLLGDRAFVVRGLYFDKPPAANWKVPWHQDLTIPVRERVEIPGFGPWSVKAGVPHVQPPVAILEAMLAVRIHLDDCGESNGPLQVLPGSHAHGRLDPAMIREWLARVPSVTCLVPEGGILLMRPLLLHASSTAREPGHRRVVHLEFVVRALPGGLQWGEA